MSCLMFDDEAVAGLSNIIVASLEFTTVSGSADNLKAYPTGFDANNTIVLAVYMKDNAGLWRNSPEAFGTGMRYFAILRADGINIACIDSTFQGRDCKVYLMRTA